MAELVYPPVIVAAKAMFALAGLRFTVTGSEKFPARGGAVVAINHTGHLDFTFAGIPAHDHDRLIRFMAKDAIFKNPVAGPLMRGMKHIPVDREAGSASYRAALAALKAGELVGVFPEATISRSYEIKEFKTGAARMAAAAGVPIIPMALWGSQRVLTYGRRRPVSLATIPVYIAVGDPVAVSRQDDAAEVTARVREQMVALLDGIQAVYPDRPSSPEDAWWLPARLGGSAPTPEEAAVIEERVRAERAAKRAAKRAAEGPQPDQA
jgi:1-acyl-sn-glycerol-3-phosphate acyltransferase